jgi:hypothetical protein
MTQRSIQFNICGGGAGFSDPLEILHPHLEGPPYRPGHYSENVLRLYLYLKSLRHCHGGRRASFVSRALVELDGHSHTLIRAQDQI